MRPAAMVGLVTLLARPLAGQTYLVVVSGLGGEPHYSETFYQWGSNLLRAASDLGLPDSQVAYLAEAPDRAPGRIAGPSTRAQLEATLRALGRRAPADATVILLLIGHGSDRGEPRLSLAGPDLSARELAALLAVFPTQRVAVVNTSSASGAFLAELAAPGRVVITATKSGFEQNHAVFAEYFIEAFSGGGADADKDERVSLLEAFRYARQAVERAYEQEQRLLTEHAMLDDDGDGAGSSEPGEPGGDGMIAATVFLAPAAVAVAAGTDADLADLVRRKSGLERRIADLRLRRDSLAAEDYDRQLETLLVELAEVDAAIRRRAAGRPE